MGPATRRADAGKLRARSFRGTPMPTIDSSVWINAPLPKVFAIAKDNRSFPEYMKDVQSVTVVEAEDGRVVSDWVGVVPQFLLKVRWRQEDLWDDASHVCKFRQLSGDYNRMSGEWTFAEDNGGTRFNSSLEYEYRVPTLGALVQKVIHGIVVKNMENVLNAIKQRAEVGG